jgi:hypothetical protein
VVPVVLSARTDAAVLAVIEQWVGLLVEERFDDAMAMLVPSGTWTPDLLATVVRNYGTVDPRDDGRTFSVTPIAAAGGDGPRFEVTWCDPPLANRLDYAPDLLGHARYDLPLDGQWSDVTAGFEIVLLPEGAVLALDDVHVM